MFAPTATPAAHAAQQTPQAAPSARQAARIGIAALLGLAALTSHGLTHASNADAVGSWTTFEAKSGQPRSIVQIEKSADGTYTGKVVQVLKPSDPAKPATVCDKCDDDRKNQPIEGLEIIRGMKTEDGKSWSGGTILDPAEGKVYRSKMKLQNNGAELEVSGCIAFFCRDQTWQRR